jgi:hypothetical protein
MSQGLTTTGDAFQAILEGPPTLEAARALHQEHKKRRIPKIKTEFRIFFKIDQGAPEKSWITALKSRMEYQVVTKVAKLLEIEQFDKVLPEFTIEGTFANIQRDVLCVLTRIYMLPPVAQKLQNILSEQKLFFDWSPSDDEISISKEIRVKFFTSDHNV